VNNIEYLVLIKNRSHITLNDLKNGFSSDDDIYLTFSSYSSANNYFNNCFFSNQDYNLYKKVNNTYYKRLYNDYTGNNKNEWILINN
jgi:hypothetical protein